MADPVFLEMCEGRYRNRATAAQAPQYRALGLGRIARRLVVQNLEQHVRAVIFAAGLDGERGLPHGGQHLRNGEEGGDAVVESQTPQPCGRKYDRVVIPFVELAQTGIDEIGRASCRERV